MTIASVSAQRHPNILDKHHIRPWQILGGQIG